MIVTHRKPQRRRGVGREAELGTLGGEKEGEEGTKKTRSLKHWERQGKNQQSKPSERCLLERRILQRGPKKLKGKNRLPPKPGEGGESFSG